MTSGKKTALWIVVALIIVGAIIAVTHRRKPVVLNGAVLRQDNDPNKQLPLAGVQIVAINELGSGHSQSDASGFFSLTLPKGLRRRQPVLLQFRREGYQPLDWHDFISDKNYIARMVPLRQESVAQSRTESPVSNPRIRYSVKSTTEANIGSAVKTFQVVNKGNQPCAKLPPCAPGGKRKAVVDSLLHIH